MAEQELKPLTIDYCPLCGTNLNDIKHKFIETKRDFLSLRLECPEQKVIVDIILIENLRHKLKIKSICKKLTSTIEDLQ